jgi:hypothetical protein
MFNFLIMERILFITAFPPNKLTAGQNYSRVLLNSLSEEFEIDLISFSYPNHVIDVNSKINILKIVGVSKLSKFYSWLHLPIFYPFFVLRFRYRLLLYLIKKSHDYKLIYFDFSQIFIYSLFIKNTFKIFMCHDVICQKIRRNKLFYLNPFNALLSVTEKLILKSADLILSFSVKDQKIITDNYNLDSNVVNFFIDDKIKLIDYSKINLSRKFSFFGAWNRPENMGGLVWFINNVLPNIDKDIKFEIIGPGIDESFADQLKGNNSITYLGFLENPYLNIAESQALIAPIFQGAGVKVKVIESLALGTSVLGTSVAFEGIDNLDDTCMILCQSKEDFIKTINTFPASSEERKESSKLLFENSYQANSVVNLFNSLGN